MNNEQFRRLMGTGTPKSSAQNHDGGPSATPRSIALGSRQKSSIPMTPRNVTGFNNRSEFARQMAERNQSNKPDKKPRSFAPKGSKLAEGYTDRAQARLQQETEEHDSRATRIKALEEAMKNEEIDQDTFEKLRAEIAGGNLESTHLVKGLDFKLLERVRRGEDVYDAGTSSQEDERESAEPEDIDDAFDRMGDVDVAPIARESREKKGQVSATPLNPGKKRTRDQVLAEMRLAREAAKAKDDSALGSRFKKIGAKSQGTRLERDGKGREVLIIVDEDGNEKRKVRKAPAAAADATEAEQVAAKAREFIPDKSATPLGMEVPEFYKKQAAEEALEDKEVNIFDDVSDEYDPLAGLGDDSGSDSEEGSAKDEEAANTDSKDKIEMPPPPKPTASTGPRNYFKDSKTGLASAETIKAPSMSDPAIQAAFKRAAALNQRDRNIDGDDDDEDEAAARAKAERHRKMLQNVDRDAEDMDMGFGTSKLGDEADFDEQRVKLSEWGAGDDEDEDGHGGRGGGGGAKRKRGGKKRKGDVNKVADVMRVVEQRRGTT